MPLRNRRQFMRTGSLAAGAAAALGGVTAPAALFTEDRREAVARAFAAPVLRTDLWPDPLVIESIELLRGGGDYVVRVRARGGAEGLAVGHPDVLQTTWPILVRRVAPFFVGKDARTLESLLDGV